MMSGMLSSKGASQEEVHHDVPPVDHNCEGQRGLLALQEPAAGDGGARQQREPLNTLWARFPSIPYVLCCGRRERRMNPSLGALVAMGHAGRRVE